MAVANCIHLLRHGQFTKREGLNDGPLTTLGRRQARYAAGRLQQWRIAKVYSSDLERASETAEIVMRKLPDLSLTTLPLLRELIPTAVRGHRVSLASRRQGKQRIEKIVDRFLTRAPRSGDTVLVCHGNLIRALLCRVLDVPLTRWGRIGTYHCAITSFGFSPSGRVYVRCLNDTGHLPFEITTTV